MNNILLTGLPGVGKSTLIKRLCIVFKEFNPAGFYTTEIIESGNSVGFAVSNLYGDTKLLAHTKIKSKYTVGRYKVDIKGFDEFVERTFSKDKKTGLYFIDEMSKVICESKKFSKYIKELLDSERPLIATISERKPGLITDITKREDIRTFEISESNRELRLKELTMAIRDLLLE